jgi:organic hydroperoxide reductase OsmC/OhrA
MAPMEVEAKAFVTLERKTWWRITDITVEVTAHAENPDAEKFEQAVRRAEEHCPITQLFNIKPVIKARILPVAAAHVA